MTLRQAVKEFIEAADRAEETSSQSPLKPEDFLTARKALASATFNLRKTFKETNGK